jgi:predicted transcriptional regulator
MSSGSGGKTIGEISRLTGRERKTVRRVLRALSKEKVTERFGTPPGRHEQVTGARLRSQAANQCRVRHD